MRRVVPITGEHSPAEIEGAPTAMLLGRSPDDAIWVGVHPRAVYLGPDGSELKLSPGKMNMITHFAEHANTVVPHEQLAAALGAQAMAAHDIRANLISQLDSLKRALGKPYTLNFRSLYRIGFFAFHTYNPDGADITLPLPGEGIPFAGGKYALHERYQVIMKPDGPITIHRNHDEIMRVLAQAGGPLSVEELSTTTGIRLRYVKEALVQLQDGLGAGTFEHNGNQIRLIMGTANEPNAE